MRVPLSTGGAKDTGVLQGTITAISGTSETYILLGPDGTPTSADDYITDATGWKGFTVDLHTTITTAQGLLVGWSTAVSDQVNVAAILDALDGSIDSTPATQTAHPNCGYIHLNNPGPLTVLFDGTITIKTIACRGHGAAYQNIVTAIV